MNELRVILVGCDETPPEYQHRVGHVYDMDVYRHAMPSVGWKGRFVGVPGEFIAPDKFEIKPVDMRTTARKYLDEAADLLKAEPMIGEPIGEASLRHARAQHLLLLAQLDILRQMEARA